jgi:hypothetical protein
MDGDIRPSRESRSDGGHAGIGEIADRVEIASTRRRQAGEAVEQMQSVVTWGSLKGVEDQESPPP